MKNMQVDWLSILRSAVEAKGRAQVCKDIGYRKTTLSLILNEKYPANTEKVRDRVVAKYGTGERDCLLLGLITLTECWRIQKMPVAAQKCCDCKYKRWRSL